jgi:putative SOS response-associated peptidase YedK
MCGRFTLTSTAEILASLFHLREVPDLPQRFNIAPTQSVAVVRPSAETGSRELVMLRWGLIPSWAADPAIGNSLINARSETVATKPSFRSAFRQRRCLVVADGFYEWQKRPGGKKQPYYFRLGDGRPFAFAGLWERWQKGEEPVESCTLLTTTANATVRPVHERMPVILQPAAYDQWLDSRGQKAEEVLPLLQPYAGADLTAYPVGTQVNNARHNGPDCVAPLP